jgi:hypothetical protein
MVTTFNTFIPSVMRIIYDFYDLIDFENINITKDSFFSGYFPVEFHNSSSGAKL